MDTKSTLLHLWMGAGGPLLVSRDALKDCMAVSIPPGLGPMRAIGGFLPLSPAFILFPDMACLKRE